MDQQHPRRVSRDYYYPSYFLEINGMAERLFFSTSKPFFAHSNIQQVIKIQISFQETKQFE